MVPPLELITSIQMPNNVFDPTACSEVDHNMADNDPESVIPVISENNSSPIKLSF